MRPEQVAGGEVGQLAVDPAEGLGERGTGVARW
jgi:hypothetical protein